MSQFIGRGEAVVEVVLKQILHPKIIMGQYAISWIISDEDLAQLGPELNKHKFDFLLEYWDYVENKPQRMAVEVNYKHGEKAAKKWKIYKELMIKYGIQAVTIDDYDCRERGVFWLNSKNVHPKITWDDYRDVIDALEKAGIEPEITI